jgi:hypothetical protein
MWTPPVLQADALIRELRAMISVEYSMENLIGFLLGWPSLGVALLLASLGVWLARPALLWTALMLSAPVALYISGSPAAPLVGVVPMGALVVAARTCQNKPRWPSILSVAVYGACLASLGFIVMNQ